MNHKILFILLNFMMLYIHADENVIWELALPGKVISTPKERNSGELILICEDRRLYSINNKIGQINWKIRLGGRLTHHFLAPDGSIIVQDEEAIYSVYGTGDIRWSLEVSRGFQSNISINDRSDILFVSDNTLYLIDRYGEQQKVKQGVNSSTITTLDNSLIAYVFDNKLQAISFSGKDAWDFDLKSTPSLLQKTEEGLAIIYSDGVVDTLTYSGELLDSKQIDNSNFYESTLNLSGDLIVYGDKGLSLITAEGIFTQTKDYDFGLYYSDGILIKSYDDWILRGVTKSVDSRFFPSGYKQKIGHTISLSGKKVWNDELTKEYYINTILSNNRNLQSRTLSEIRELIGTTTLLDEFPNFYDVLLTATSSQNKNQDIRQEAYMLIGDSKDINFIPYLYADLIDETSYQVLSYIFYGIGQLAVDRTGIIVEGINKKLDGYFDEKMVINSLYALYYISKYNNGENLENIFLGIEKIINGGYSRNIENQCYDVLEKVR